MIDTLCPDIKDMKLELCSMVMIGVADKMDTKTAYSLPPRK